MAWGPVLGAGSWELRALTQVSRFLRDPQHSLGTTCVQEPLVSFSRGFLEPQERGRAGTVSA